MMRRLPLTRKPLSFRPQLEALEDRCLLSFGTPITTALYQPSTALVAADVNGDGKLDAVTVSNATGILVWLGNGKGHFKLGSQLLPEGTNTPTALAVADINGDGKPDIIVANDPGDGGAFGVPPSISVFLNNGTRYGTFTATRTDYVLSSDARFLAVGDFDGDGSLDLVTAAAQTDYFKMVTVLRNAGPTPDGFFPTARSYAIPNTFGAGNVTSVAVGDFNGDGKPDIVATSNDNYSNGNVNVLLNNGDGSGTFGAAQAYAVGGFATSVAVGDFNGDGKPDLAVTTETPSATGNSYAVSVLQNLGDGTGAFAPARTYAVGGGASVAAGDFNQDGKIDIVTTGAEMDVLLNNGDGTFAPAQKVGPAGSQVVVANFNSDGYADLAQIDGSGAGIDVLLNKADWQTHK
jgi:hypothetical protein